MRHDLLPDPEAAGQDECWSSAIRDEIATGGPITFARFMERALYEPGTATTVATGRHRVAAGDFLTAPEAHPIFGAAVGRLLEQAWAASDRPDRFLVSEPGVGDGALAERPPRRPQDLRSPLAEAVRYRRSRSSLAGSMRSGGSPRGGWARRRLVTGPRGRTPRRTGAVVANEVLDALPVHRVIGRGGDVRELLVDVDRDGKVCPGRGGAHDPGAGAPAGGGGDHAGGRPDRRGLPGGGRLAAGAARRLRPASCSSSTTGSRPCSTRRSAATGTLRAFAGTPWSRPLPPRRAPGPDGPRGLAAVRAAAASAGLDPVGETTQAELLAAVGTGALRQLRAPARCHARGRAAPPIGPRPSARPARHGRLPGPCLRPRPPAGPQLAGLPAPRPVRLTNLPARLCGRLAAGLARLRCAAPLRARGGPWHDRRCECENPARCRRVDARPWSTLRPRGLLTGIWYIVGFAFAARVVRF